MIASDATVLVRAMQDISLVALFGACVFHLAVAAPALAGDRVLADALRRPFGAILAAALALAFISTVPWLVLETSAMAGEPPTASLPFVGTVLASTHFGHVLCVRSALLVIAALALLVTRRTPAASWVACVAAGLALAAGAMIGHAAAHEGATGTGLVAAEAAHLLAAGAWLGSLPPLLVLLGAAARSGRVGAAAVAARRFSPLGIVCVAVLAASGAAYAVVMIPHPDALLAAPYGKLVLSKAGLFLALLGLAALNRVWLTPALAGADATADARRLCCTVAGEIALGLAVLSVAALLASTAPPHEHPPPHMQQHAHHHG